MGEYADRAKGVLDETLGKAKRAIGEATGNAELTAEGDVQEAKGDAEKLKAKVEGTIS